MGALRAPNDLRHLRSGEQTPAKMILTPLISLHGIRHKFISHTDMQNGAISLDVRENEIVCVVGASGSGKTSLLKIALGLLKATQGTVSLRIKEDSNLPCVGVAFQSVHFLPWRNMEDNVRAPIAHSKATLDNQRSAARAVLERASLDGVAHRFPHELSGGMRARAALARALVNDPSLLLLDEPFNSVDAYLRDELHELLADLVHDQQLGALIVTHDLDHSLAFADRLVVIGCVDGETNPTIDLNARIGSRGNRRSLKQAHALREYLIGFLRTTRGETVRDKPT